MTQLDQKALRVIRDPNQDYSKRDAELLMEAFVDFLALCDPRFDEEGFRGAVLHDIVLRRVR